MSEKILEFFRVENPPTPCLAVDIDQVEKNCRDFITESGWDLLYALKANPAKEIVRRLATLSCGFDAASYEEILLCLECGVDPASISWGNTVKSESQIRAAHRQGVDQFAFDSAEELAKIAHAAPGSRVFCRVTVGGGNGSCSVTGKFGCLPDQAFLWLKQARDQGLDPQGVSFHVGSQQTDPRQWRVVLGEVAPIFHRLREEAGISLPMLNLGGGFPVHYRQEVPKPSQYYRVIRQALRDHFGNHLPGNILCEPGRAISATAGIIRSKVLLVTHRTDSAGQARRWVYLDVGRSTGLTEGVSHRIVYPVTEEKPDGATAEAAILAGPTCDWKDVLNGHCACPLSKNLQVGDHLHLHHTGAYTETCSTVSFNGFAPLRSYRL